MADESFDMQAEAERELSKGDFAGGGIRYLAEAMGMPTDRESIDVAISGIPGYSLAEGVSGGRLSEMLEGVGQEASIEELINSMTDLPVEEAALAATVMGAMSPGGRFKSIGEALNEVTKRYKDKLTRNYRFGPPLSDYQLHDIKDRSERLTTHYRDNADAFDMGLTDKVPDLSRLEKEANDFGVDISDITEEVRSKAIPTRPRSKYYDEYDKPSFPSDITNPDHLNRTKHPDAREGADRRHRSALTKQAREDRDRIERGVPPRDTNFVRRNAGIEDDQLELDFNQQDGLASLFGQLSESNKTVGKNEFFGLDQMLEEGLKPKNVNKPPSTYNPPSKRFAALSDEGKKKIQGLLNDRNKLSGELNKDSVGGNKAMSMQRQLEVLEAQLRPFFPIDKMANGGRPGTVRRRKVTSPAGYKAGGQVYQKGYYGKSYK